MTNTLRDFSKKPELLPLAAVARALQEIGRADPADFLLVGAGARDVWLRHAFGIDPGRETADVDFAIAVADWNTFALLRNRLIGSGEFEARGGAATHRLRHRSGIPLDIVPFGGVERPDRTIAWPPEQREIFNCFGLQEALRSSHAVMLPSGIALTIASIPALVLLKINAWRDRAHDGKDAKDLLLYLRNYLDCGQFDLAAEQHADLFDDPEFDYEVASARLLGRHLSALLDDAAKKRILAVIEPESLVDGRAFLARQSGLEIPRACRMIAALCDELRSSIDLENS